MDNDLLIDFEDDSTSYETAKEETKKYKKIYNNHTTDFYCLLREKKYNVISHDSFDCHIDQIFQFPYIWDPYTGEREEKDPFGPFYFHPDDLIRFFYKRRLKLLWHEPKDITTGPNAGYYEGYYGEGVGSGEDILIPGRGFHPELYLFRLPIDDCYMPPYSDLSIITMGPKLTNDELALIDELAEKYHKHNYQNCYKKKRPSLALMKKLYDNALSKTPDLSKYKIDEKNLSKEELENLRNKANREAVTALINI
jgi:hypothetical protein